MDSIRDFHGNSIDADATFKYRGFDISITTNRYGAVSIVLYLNGKGHACDTVDNAIEMVNRLTSTRN